jgi:hypothetical protein
MVAQANWTKANQLADFLHQRVRTLRRLANQPNVCSTFLGQKRLRRRQFGAFAICHFAQCDKLFIVAACLLVITRHLGWALGPAIWPIPFWRAWSRLELRLSC